MFNVSRSRLGGALLGAALALMATAASAVADPLPATNGKMIFTRTNPYTSLYSMTSSGGLIKPITPLVQTHTYPTYSWSGTKLAAIRGEVAGRSQVELVNPLTGTSTDVTSGPGEKLAPAFTPNDKRLVYTSDEDGDRDIYSIALDGTGRTNLTPSSHVDDSSPSVGPDGDIYFERDFEIWRMNSDGSGATALTDSPGFDTSPSVSRAGDRVVFSSTRSGIGADIYVMKSNGAAETALTDDGDANLCAAFSPDGKWIAWCSSHDGTSSWWEFDIYKMRTDGSDRSRLTADHGIDAEPTWQPLVKPGSTVSLGAG